MPSLAGHRFGDGLGVAGDQDDLDAQLVQCGDGLPRLLAHLAGHGSTSASSAWSASSSRRGPPTRTVLPSTVAVTPTAGDELKSVDALPGNADSDLRDWDPGYPAVKENVCSCIFAAPTTVVHTV
jgi:hypothetical protein